MKLYLRALGLFALVYMGILVGFSSPIYAQNRQVRAWGNNVEGTLGDGTNTDSNTPVQVSGLTNVVQISCGNGSSLALKSDGTVWAWGYNGSGQLGDGTIVDKTQWC